MNAAADLILSYPITVIFKFKINFGSENRSFMLKPWRRSYT